MKAICIGDPHFQVDNIPEVELFISKLIHLVRVEKPDFVVVMGDVLHTHERLHTIPLNKAYEFIHSLRALCQTFVLVGNHDMTSNQNFLTDQHWMNGMKEWSNVTIVDKTLFWTKNNYNFVFVPYVPCGKFMDALNIVDWKGCHCIFAHQEFKGCKMGAIISEHGDEWNMDYPDVISGHIHSNQTINNVYYCGSSMQHAFGESEKNIIAVVEWTNSETYDLREVDLELPRKRIIYTDMDKIDKLEVKNTEDKLKITLKGSYDEFKSFKKTQKYRELSKKAKIVFKTTKSAQKIAVDCKETDFSKILDDLVYQEKNSLVYKIHQKLVYDQETDIIFI